MLPRYKGYGRRVWHRPATSHGLNLFYLQLNSGLLPRFLAEALILFVHIHNELLNMIASDGVLVEVPGAYAQVKRLIALFVPGTLLKAGTLTSEAKLHDVLLILVGARATAAYLDDALHVAPLRTDESAGHLKLLVVVNLDVESAGILDIFIVSHC